MERIPFTPLGLVTAVGALGAWVVGVLANWIEFAIVGTALFLALLTAIPYLLGGRKLRLERELQPTKVHVGDSAVSVLSIFNDGATPSAPRVVEDNVAGQPISIDVPAIGAGSSTTKLTDLPTDRRGVIKVGPALLTKADPLGMARVDRGQTGELSLWVRPRVTPLAGARAGFAKDLEGPTFDNSPDGDVAFHTIREYERGDDIRHIHWMSTARTGDLMVRHFVDNRRPYLAVVVDNRTDSASEDQFERMLEIAASQVLSAELDGRPIALWVGNQEVVSNQVPADLDTGLDRLCISDRQADGQDLLTTFERASVVDPALSTTLIVTGPIDGKALLPVVQKARRFGAVIVTRVVDPSTKPISIPGARVFDATSLKAFAVFWKAVVA